MFFFLFVRAVSHLTGNVIALVSGTGTSLPRPGVVMVGTANPAMGFFSFSFLYPRKSLRESRPASPSKKACFIVYCMLLTFFCDVWPCRFHPFCCDTARICTTGVGIVHIDFSVLSTSSICFRRLAWQASCGCRRMGVLHMRWTQHPHPWGCVLLH